MPDDERDDQPDDEREEKMFDRAEAERLLPTIERLLTGAIEKKKRLGPIEQEFSQAQKRIQLLGGILPPYARLTEKKLERENLVGGIRQALSDLQETGCVVKDLDIGLVDFPSIVNDEPVYLCWRLGEERIGFWHRADEGFAGRKPLDDAGPGAGTRPN